MCVLLCVIIGAMSRGGEYRAPFLEGCPENTEHLFQTGLCLPSGTALSIGDLDRIVSIVLGVLGIRIRDLNSTGLSVCTLAMS